MKKLSSGLAAVGLTASMAATAALPTGAAPFQINIPNLKSGLMFNLTGLYLRPTNEDLDYVAIVPENPTGNTTNVNVLSVKPGYDFGFHLGFGYVFPNSGNDVQIGWIHLKVSDGDSANVGPAETDYGPIDAPDLFALGGGKTGTAHGEVHFKYNAGDLDVGQYVNIGTRLTMRLFAGLRYASIDRDLDQHFIDNTSPGSEALEINNSSDMSGVGPRFGVDSSYHISNCFGVVGGVSTALLVSRIKTETVYRAAAGSGNPDDVVILRPDSVNRIVPNVESKLGLDYTRAFNGALVSIEAGYKVSHYFNAIDRVSATGYDAPNTIPGDLESIVRKTSSFGVDGPYLSLSLKVH